MSTDAFIRPGEARSATPLRYDACGLDGIYLCNGYEILQRNGVEFLEIIEREDLHQAIAIHLVTSRKVLSPKEVKFIRVEMDYTQKQLGDKLGTTSQSIARWEKGQTDIPGAADRLMRIIFLHHTMKPNDFKRMVGEMSSLLDNIDESRNRSVHFEHEEHWFEQELAAAA